MVCGLRDGHCGDGETQEVLGKVVEGGCFVATAVLLDLRFFLAFVIFLCCGGGLSRTTSRQFSSYLRLNFAQNPRTVVQQHRPPQPKGKHTGLGRWGVCELC